MEMILLGAKELTNADGGTLYQVEDGKRSALRNPAQRYASTSPWAAPPATRSPSRRSSSIDEAGNPNHKNISAHAAVTGKTINVEDAYDAEPFRLFRHQGLRFARPAIARVPSCAVPLKNHDGEVVGVLQLINARDDDGKVIPFSDRNRRRSIEALASQAAVALDNQMLLDAQKNLFTVVHLR